MRGSRGSRADNFHSRTQAATLFGSVVHSDAEKCSTVHYNTVQCSALQYSKVQCTTIQYSALQYSTVQCTTIHYSAVQYNTVQCSALQYTPLKHCNAKNIAVKGFWCIFFFNTEERTTVKWVEYSGAVQRCEFFSTCRTSILGLNSTNVCSFSYKHWPWYSLSSPMADRNPSLLVRGTNEWKCVEKPWGIMVNGVPQEVPRPKFEWWCRLFHTLSHYIRTIFNIYHWC